MKFISNAFGCLITFILGLVAIIFVLVAINLVSCTAAEVKATQTSEADSPFVQPIAENKLPINEQLSFERKEDIDNPKLLTIVYSDSMKEAQSKPPIERIKKRIKQVQPKYTDIYVNDLAETIVKQSEMFHIDPILVASLIENTSYYNHDMQSGGKIGIMQVFPETAYKIGNEVGIHIDPTIMVDNIAVGIFILNEALEHCDNDIRLAITLLRTGDIESAKKGGDTPFYNMVRRTYNLY